MLYGPFAMLDLTRPELQVGYYDPGVGTFSSPSAWTPMARTVSRFAGLMFGAGLRQNLGEAYSYLISVYEPDDRIFVFGFSRGAYTARALTGDARCFRDPPAWFGKSSSICGERVRKAAEAEHQER